MAISTNVLNIPGNYIIRAINGIVTIETTRTRVTQVLQVDGDTFLNSDTTIGNSPSDTIDTVGQFINDLIPQSSYTVNIGTSTNIWNSAHLGRFVQYGTGSAYLNIINNTENVWNPYTEFGPAGRPYDPGNIYGTTEQRQQGALYVAGGVGIEKDLNVGGFIYGRVETAVTTTFVTFTATNADIEFNLGFVLQDTPEDYQSPTYIDLEGIADGLTYNPALGRVTTDRAFIAEGDQSTSTTTGALIVQGGVGIAKNAYVGGILTATDVMPKAHETGTIGSTDTTWAEAYINDIYTRVIQSTTGTIQIDPAAGITEIIGDIRVRGQNPVGTAPVVTNTLYVTMDGNDTNDGRAMDPSRACRTIGGAVNSPYFQPGTQILVSAGFYLEDNPVRMKPYTSIRGSDIRTTFIEPINKTQDLFHVDSGCYINYVTFLNGRSGLLQGPYEDQYNRGAYATAFPPQVGDNRIDIYHSPYIQNCTNQSGPWLGDGTMFVPNQTVQVPASVGIGSWLANTSSIIVDISQGSVERGMYVNAGQQNPGFFDARTLILANKPFIQEQVIAYVDKTFNTGTFIYDQVKCARDTGLIVDSVAQDMLADSISESIFAGLQYWRQTEYVDAINSQITATIATIEFVRNLAASTATSAASATEGAVVTSRFNNILEILNTSTATLVTGAFSEWVTNKIISNGTATTSVGYNAAFDAILAAKNSITEQAINNLNSTLIAFTYDSAKCARDTGLIVDSVAQDILFNGTSQSTFAGLQYWNQSGYVSGIGSQLTTTTNAIEYVKELAAKVVVGNTSGTRYQTSIAQNTSLSTATSAESTLLNDDFDVILNILDVGTVGVSDDIVPNGLVPSTNTNVLKAYNLLQANKTYIQTEVIAFVEATKTVGFEYDQDKCFRDTGYMLDSVAFDMLYGGNKQAIQSGVYYYGFDAGSSAIEGQSPQTIAAYEYIKQLAPNIIRGIAISTSTLYQSAEQQVLGLSGTPIEANEAIERLDIIVNIINNGPSVAEEPAPISLDRSPNTYVQNAAILLNENRDFIKAEVVAYVNTLKTLVYDETKCRRDIGYMLDSVAYDLLHGGNKQSIKSGVYYFGYTGDTTEIPNEIPQTTAAYNFIKSLLPSIIKAQPVISKYSSAVQDITTYLPATDNEVTILGEKIDVITNIIRNGPGAVDARIPINTELNQSSNIYNAYKQLEANREFIKDEVIAYLDTFGTFNYSREKCFRDVGIILENISYDAAFGGNEKAVQSGLSYYNGVVSLIAGQEVQTVAAIDYINNLAQKVIVNEVCPDLYSTGISTTATYAQVINTAVTGGGIAGRSLSDLFNVVTTIINNGPAAAPQMFKGTNADAAFVSAETLMQANRAFIQQDTINYINNLVLNFPYSEIKCRRDTGLIVDSIAFDMLYQTPGYSQSTFAGLQYWNQDQYVGDIQAQLAPTVDAVRYLKELAIKIVQNITPADDLVVRYQSTVTQVTSLEPATLFEANIIEANFDVILDILGGNSLGWTDRIVPNSTKTGLPAFLNAYDLLLANKNYMAHEVTAYVDATNFGFNYDANKCRRDVGHMVDAVSFDLVHSGNRQSVQTGLYYYGFDSSTITIQNQEIQTTAAFDYLADLAELVVTNQHVNALQTRVNQFRGDTSATMFDAGLLRTAISTITNIITNGPSVNYSATAIAMTATSTASTYVAFELLYANKEFLVEEVIAYIDKTYNPNSFNYNEAKCYRDIGLIVDAVSQDVLLGGNAKSIEAGLAYWTFGENSLTGQETTTTMAFNYARDLSLQIIANQPVTPQTGTVIQQIINPFFQYGADYMPQEAVRRNFDIISTIVNRGTLYAPPKYLGGGLFALTGINGSDVLTAPIVTSITTISEGKYLIGLNTATIGFGTNATVYFGDVLTFPLRDNEVDELSLEYTGDASTWNQRKIDRIGGMGGALIDGAVVSDRSPIQSFVFDAYTQLTQGGRGVRITNNGYAQLVSVFTVFSSVGVQVDNGGIASIVNSNANFGDICLLAKGYGPRKFSGQIYNPAFRAYPESPNIPGGDYFDQYYPEGFWPNNAQIAVYLPDQDDRPHISLVMEIVPPEGYLNEQNLPGFLNASPTTSTLSTGTIILENIDTTNVFVGNTVIVRDQFGNTTSTVVDSTGNWVPYALTGTVVTDVGFNSITLSNALAAGGGELDNPNFFDFYFCGNSYYTVLTSELLENPEYNDKAELIPLGINILSTASTGGDTSQIPAHISAMQYLNSLTNLVINNAPITSLQTGPSTSTQTFLPLVRGGGDAQTFIDLRFGEITDIINAPDLTAAENVIRPSLRTKEGPAVQGGGSAITLIAENIEFLADEITAYVTATFATSTFTYDETLCRRDAGYILDGVYYDTAIGSNWNAVYSGIAYRRSVSTVVTASQLTQTIGAVVFLREQAELAMATSTTATTRSNAAFDEILNILEEGEGDADTVVYPTPTGMSVGNPKLLAKNILLANKSFMQAEVIAWIEQQISIGSGIWSGFTYNSATCARDVGYIVDSLIYDILYDGTWATTISARSYFEGTTSVITGETAQTAAAFDRLSTVAQQVVRALTVTVSPGNTIMQNTILPGATVTESGRVNTLLQIIEDVITSGDIGTLPSPVTPTIGWADAGVQTAINQLDTDQSQIIDDMITYINDEFVGSFNFDSAQCQRDVKTILQRLIYDIETGGRYNAVMCGLAYWNRAGTYHKVSLGENVTRTDLFPHNSTVNFYQRSYISASGYVFEYVGAGIDYGALPQRGKADPIQARETVQLDSGKVFFTSTDQNGDFRIGPGLVISQATGVLSGRTFTRSLFANMTPFILAIN
jgi:hypothetical protein